MGKNELLWTDFLLSVEDKIGFNSKISPEPAKPTISLALVHSYFMALLRHYLYETGYCIMENFVMPLPV